MNRINFNSVVDSLLFTTFRIYTYFEDGNCASATGFVFDYMHSGEHHAPMLVTNRHVVERGIKWDFHFIQGQNNCPLLGVPYKITMTKGKRDWFFHPKPDVDIAILPFAVLMNMIQEQQKELYHLSVSQNEVPNEEQIAKINSIEDVFMVGYPNEIYDTVNLTPIVRKGITATPILIENEGQKRFLVDISIFPGSSGSPVFLYRPFSKAHSNHETLLFIGILSAGFFRTEDDKKEMIDLGVVYNWQAVLETITCLLVSCGQSKPPGN